VRIALDATYSVDANPSGIAVYSRELLDGLAAAHPEDEFFHCYRAKQFPAAGHPHCANVNRRLLLPPLPTFRVDIFHALNQRVDRRPAKGVVSTFHDLFVLTNEYSSSDFRERFASQARKAAANSDLIIAVSEFTATQVSALLNVPRSRIRVVPHGVRPSEQVALARQKMVLFVGALQVRKNIIRLVEAFEQMPSDWILNLVGAVSGFGAGEIVRRIESSGARARINVKGYLPAGELQALYAQASIFAFPSLDEGFGMPILEAMIRGIPVVTSNRSAVAEVADNAALLVNPYRTEEIAKALLRLAADETLRTTLAQAGRTRAQTFTWQAAVDRTYAVYKELTA
jgi:glycosyltransferase involved in cell wall biosynthesis